MFGKLWELLTKKPTAPQPVATPTVAPKPVAETPVEAPKSSRRRTNKAGEDLIKAAESLELAAYPDPASPLGVACTKAKLFMRSYRKVPGWEKLSGDPWTIGWGHTGVGTVQGLEITQETAQSLLESDLEKFERGVESLVKTKISDNQFGALVSFAYNCGLKNLENSTLLKKVNAGDFAGAADEFLKWANVKEKDVNGKPTGKLIPLKGLVIRRGAEKDLFLKP